MGPHFEAKAFRGLLAAAMATALLLGGCGENRAADTGTSAAETAEPSAAQIDTGFSAGDLDVGYEESTATRITLNKTTVSVEGEGVSAAGNVITIKAAGTYVLNGPLEDGQILVNAGEGDKVQLVLNGVALSCSNYTPLYVKQADKVFVTLPAGARNILSDGGPYQLDGDDGNMDGAYLCADRRSI